jgi:TonB family protein
MRSAVIGSMVVHLAVTIVLFAFRMPVKVIVPGPDVVQVALIEPESSPAPTVAPTPPAPEPEEQGIQIEPDKKKPPKQKAEPVPEPPKPAPPRAETKPQAPARPVTGLPSARIGTAGLRGDIGTDSNFEFAYYLQLVRDRIATNWSPPSGMVSGGTVRTVVYFRIGRGGDVSSVRLESASGSEFFDRAAVRAVMVSDPMPPLPLGFGGGELGVHFGFDWEAP